MNGVCHLHCQPHQDHTKWGSSFQWKKRRTGEYVWHIAALTISLSPRYLGGFLPSQISSQSPRLECERASLLVDGGSPTIRATERYTKDTLKLAPKQLPWQRFPQNTQNGKLHWIAKWRTKGSNHSLTTPPSIRDIYVQLLCLRLEYLKYGHLNQIRDWTSIHTVTNQGSWPSPINRNW